MEPRLIEGIPCYAPEIAARNEGFPPGKFERLYRAEERNFWYRSRSRLVARLVARFLPPGPADFIEVGCGTASMLKDLDALGRLRLFGAEAYVSALALAKTRLPQAEFVQLDAARMPFSERFDAAGLFDVLEHVEDDASVLAGVRKALRPGGLLFITVPQHAFLWSANDDASFHKRRYARGELLGKLRAAGLEPLFTTSYVTALFPVLLPLRLLKAKASGADPYEAVLSELELPGPLNAVLGAAMRLDEALIALGVSLPFGGSLAAVARKPI